LQSVPTGTVYECNPLLPICINEILWVPFPLEDDLSDDCGDALCPAVQQIGKV